MFPQDPSRKGVKSLNNIDRQSAESMQPYSQFSNLGSQISDQYGRMMNDPNSYIKDMRSGYEQTPGHKRALYDSMMSANNAAASSGMIGTPMHQEQMMETAAGVNDQYERQWVNDAMNQQRYGMSGQQGLFNNSMNSNMYLNDIQNQTEANRGELNIGMADAKNKRRQELIQFLLGSASGSFGGQGGGGMRSSGQSSGSGMGKALAGMAAGAAGAYFGGPAGGAAGSQAGNAAYDYFYPSN